VVELIIKKRWFRKQKIQIPTSYEDLTFGQILSIDKAKTHDEILKEILEDNYQYLNYVYPYLEFLRHEFKLPTTENKHIKINDEIYLVPNIRSKSFGHKIYFGQLLKNKDVFQNMCRMVACYLTDKLSDENISKIYIELFKCNFFDVYGVYLNLINQYNELVRLENLIPKPPTTAQEKNAGIEKFSELGDFNTIDLIATRNNYKHEEVECLSYEIIFLLLHRINRLSIYETNLRNEMKKV
jgi:predicted O-linked N-acetylglucosamine transferase (SPINDLY family)